MSSCSREVVARTDSGVTPSEFRCHLSTNRTLVLKIRLPELGFLVILGQSGARHFKPSSRFACFSRNCHAECLKGRAVCPWKSSEPAGPRASKSWKRAEEAHIQLVEIDRRWYDEVSALASWLHNHHRYICKEQVVLLACFDLNWMLQLLPLCLEAFCLYRLKHCSLFVRAAPLPPLHPTACTNFDNNQASETGPPPTRRYSISKYMPNIKLGQLNSGLDSHPGQRGITCLVHFRLRRSAGSLAYQL